MTARTASDPRRVLHRSALAGTLAVFFLCALATGGCADDDTPAPGPQDTVAEVDTGHTPPIFSDTRDEDIGDGPDIETPDDVASDTDAEHLSDTLPDITDEVDIIDLRPDRDPPEVIFFAPADGAERVPTNFLVEVHFSEPLLPSSVVLHDTVRITDAVGNNVPGTLTKLPSDDEVTIVEFRPAGTTLPGSPFNVEITTGIRDKAFNRLETFVRFRFYTEPTPAPAHHVELAARYAPNIYQQTSTPNPEYDYITRMDFHGEFDLNTTAEALRTVTSIPAHVYFTVVESKSHWYITYLFFHPVHANSSPDRRHSNHMGGLQVVVARYPEERPIFVQVYSKTDRQEDILAYATSESGITGTYVTGVYPQADLFPEGRFETYLRASNHQTCAWVDRTRNAPPDLCILDATQIPNLPLVVYEYKDGMAEAIERGAQGFPTRTQPGESIGYELESLTENLWPRRMDLQPRGKIFKGSFTFESLRDMEFGQRPGRDLSLGSQFISTVGLDQSFSRAPWAWEWKPQFGGMVSMRAGTFFLDPALFLRKRIMTLSNWNPDTKLGYSVDYCYHPFFLLNFFTIDPHCAL